MENGGEWVRGVGGELGGGGEHGGCVARTIK